MTNELELIKQLEKEIGIKLKKVPMGGLGATRINVSFIRVMPPVVFLSKI